MKRNHFTGASMTTTTKTTSKQLDELSEEVLSIILNTTPTRNYTAAVPQIFRRYALRVTADNLRAWHVRRVALEVADRTPADIRCPIDDYSEAIAVWREARLTWSTIEKLLVAPAPDGFGFVTNQGALRNWWHRRKARGLKMQAGLKDVSAGVRSFQTSNAGTDADASPRPFATPAQRPDFAVGLDDETPTQRAIRESRLEAAGKANRQDALLDRLAQAQAPVSAAQ